MADDNSQIFSKEALDKLPMIDPSRSAVFIVNQDRKLVRRSIRAGVDDGTFVEILDGLNEGDIVVTSGTGGLEEGMKASLTLEGGGNNG